MHLSRSAALLKSDKSRCPIDDLIVGFDKFRDFAGLSVDEGLKIFPAIAKGAQALGVSVDDMSASISAMMVNANLQGKDVVKVIDQMTKAGQDYRLEFNQLVKSAPRLTEVMGEWGYTGVRGNAAALAWLASLRKVSSGTDEAAEALAKVMELMTNPSTAEKLGYTSDSMAAGLKKAQAAGKDTLSVFLDVVAQAQARGVELSEIFSKREIRFIRQLMRDRRDIKDWSADIQNSTGTAGKSFRVWAEGSKKSIFDVTNEIKNLMDTFGELLIRLGAVNALENATKALRELMQVVDFIGESIENNSIDWEKFVGITKLNASVDAMVATWRRRIEQMKAYASGNATSPALVEAQHAEAEAVAKLDGAKLPKIKLGDVRSAVGLGAGGNSASGLPTVSWQSWFDHLLGRRELTEEERKGTEQLKKLNDSGDALDQTLKKMKFTLEGSGPGGAQVWKASYGGGPGGVGGAREYGGGAGGFGPGVELSPSSMPYAGGGRFGGAGLGELRRKMMGLPSGGGGGPGGGLGHGSNAASARERSGVTARDAGIKPEFPVNPGVNWQNMDAEYIARMNALYRDMPEDAKGDFRMTSGYRPATRAEARALGMPESSSQESIWERSGHGTRFAAAPPGRSQHQGGAAGDFSSGRGLTWAQQHASEYGMTGILGGLHGRDPVHLQLAPSDRRFSGLSARDGGGSGAISRGSGDVNSAINDAAKAYGFDPSTLKAIASIESSMQPGSNRGRATQYKGLFQMGREEWNQYGGEGDVYGARDNAMAAAHMLRDHASWFQSKYGRAPTDAELYMMHQQGRGHFTRGAMTNIGGNPYPGMSGPQTPESFRAGWGRELARRKAAFSDGDGMQTIVATPPRTLQGYGHPGSDTQDSWGRGARPAPYMSDDGGALGSFSRHGGREDTPPRDSGDDFDSARRARQELERPIRANLDLGGSTQFGRASMRREADREVREARFSSTMDIGAA